MRYWDELVSAAMLGTARELPTPPDSDEALNALLARLDRADPEGFILAAAAALPLHRRAGYAPRLDRRPLPDPARPDERPRCSAKAGAHLRLMIRGHFADVLPEWLAAVKAAGKRVPEEVLPELLDYGREKPELRSAVLAVIGVRGHWLARQDPKWSYWVNLDIENTWHTGALDTRLSLLRWLRRTDPAGALDLLRSTWEDEETVDRYKLLAALETGLSMADEPFLEEEALDDSTKRVRRLAARLLGRLPGSRLSRRMLARGARLLWFKPARRGQPGDQIGLALVDESAYDASMQRDGISREPNRRLAASGQVAPGLWRTLQILQVIPPAHWEATFGRPPAELIRAAGQGVYAGAILEAWSQAANAHNDPAWAEALLPSAIERKDHSNLFLLMSVLPPARREAILLDMLKTNPKPLRGSHPALMPLRLSPHTWSETLARAVLDNWRRYLKRGNARPDPEMREALYGFARYMPPVVYDEAQAVLTMETSGGRIWNNGVREFLRMFGFRREMLAAVEEGRE